jgi:CHAD domain-containing protein
LGDLRDLDVMTERVRGQMEDTDADAIATLDRVLERLDERREGAIRRAHHAARRPGLRRTLDALAEWLNDPRFTGLATMPAGEVIPDLYLPALARLLLHPGWELRGTPSPDLPGAAVLHDLRWRVKLLRYRVECLEDWFGEDATAWLEELHAIQDALGAWHDDRVLMAWLRDALAPEAVVGRVREHARAALAPWEGWRARYLDPRQRRLMRRVLALGGSAHTHPSGFRTSPDQ